MLIHLPPKLPGWMCLENGFNLFPLSVPKDKIDQNAKDLYSVGFLKRVYIQFIVGSDLGLAFMIKILAS